MKYKKRYTKKPLYQKTRSYENTRQYYRSPYDNYRKTYLSGNYWEYFTDYSYPDNRRIYHTVPEYYKRPSQQLIKQKYIKTLQNQKIEIYSNKPSRCKRNSDYRRHLHFKALATGTKKYLQPRKKHRC